MNIPADILPRGLLLAAYFVFAILFLAVALHASWRQLANATRLNTWLGAIVFLLVLWRLSAEVHPGQAVHFLGATLATLMFGVRLALMALTAVMLGLCALGELEPGALPVNALIMAAVPVAASRAVLFTSRRLLPRHPFVYIFVPGLFGGTVAMLATGVAAVAVLWGAGVYPLHSLAGEYLLFFILLGWGEGFLTAGAITLLVVYRPEWLATFDPRVDRPRA
ncbi:MAG: energy-coupling factor ABC transporter permease [Burkholderiales bacterium]